MQIKILLLAQTIVRLYDISRKYIMLRKERHMKNIIITGCNGQLGRALNELYASDTEYRLINTDIAELDITDIDKVIPFVREAKPYAVINCAAHTRVDACESEEDSAFKINAIGPRNLSIAASETNAKLIQVSTDYIFSGNSIKPYREFDAPGPQTAYGRTKLAGENFVKEFADRYFIIRTAWLYGDGNNFVKTMLRLSETNDTVRVVKDQIGNPTSAKELAAAIACLLPTDNYGTFHGTCEGICSWADFAAEIFRQAGKATQVEAITTAEYPTPAVRPAYSALENYMLNMTTNFKFAEWKNALTVYMKTLSL